MALNSYGSILSFAIELEGQLRKFYEGIASLDESFDEAARRYAKRRTRMSQIRQDHVTEIILEPISGLDESNYGPLPSTTPADRANALTEAIRLETLAARFYTDCAPKMNVTEVIRAFQKFAQENYDRLDSFKDKQ